jgi:hypothetical protein
MIKIFGRKLPKVDLNQIMQILFKPLLVLILIKIVQIILTYLTYNDLFGFIDNINNANEQEIYTVSASPKFRFLNEMMTFLSLFYNFIILIISGYIGFKAYKKYKDNFYQVIYTGLIWASILVLFSFLRDLIFYITVDFLNRFNSGNKIFYIFYFIFNKILAYITSVFFNTSVVFFFWFVFKKFEERKKYLAGISKKLKLK